jgi:hypothetical protein
MIISRIRLLKELTARGYAARYEAGDDQADGEITLNNGVGLQECRYAGGYSVSVWEDAETMVSYPPRATLDDLLVDISVAATLPKSEG